MKSVLFIVFVLCHQSLVKGNVGPFSDGDLTNVLRDVLSKVVKGEENDIQASGCQCQNFDCGCCLLLDLPKVGLNDTGCVNISYLPQELGIEVTLTVDGVVWLQEKISAKNPPPLCAGIPGLKDIASICLDFYNLDVTSTSFSGCIKLQLVLYKVIDEDVDLGCFKIPFGPKLVLSDIELEAQKEWLKILKIQQEKQRKLIFF